MRWITILGLGSLLSCGDPIVDAQYRGEPIFKVKGQIESFLASEQNPAGDHPVLASLFWMTDPFEPTLVEQSSVSTQVQFPAGFELQVFHPPGSEHFLLDGQDRIAYAFLLIYVDVDEDGRFGGPDFFIGGSDRQGLLYAESSLAIDSSPFDARVPSGFSVMALDRFCSMGASEGPPPPLAIDERFALTGLSCDLDLQCADRELSCLPVLQICVPSSGSGDRRPCDAQTSCLDNETCHPMERVCVPAEPGPEDSCSFGEACLPGYDCLDYFSCVFDRPPEDLFFCENNRQCEPGFICDPRHAICVPGEPFKISVPGYVDLTALSCR